MNFPVDELSPLEADGIFFKEMVPQIYIGFNFPGGLEGEWRLVLLYFFPLPPSSIEGIHY